VTNLEHLISAHRVAAAAIRKRLNASGDLADDFDDSDAIRLALEEMEIRHWKVIERLRARAARESA
jgi:rRNA maturation protein Rpf1